MTTMQDQRTFTSKAIACVKASIGYGETDTDGVNLSRENVPVLRDLGNGLVVAYLVDDGQRFLYVQYRHLDKDGINPEQLHELAFRNLETQVGGQVRVAPQGDIFAVLADGNFEASLLLLDDLWDSALRQFVVGQYVVVIPTRDVLAFCDAASTAGVQTLREVVRRLRSAGGDHPVSDGVFVRQANGWARIGSA